jgi:hypothetical protein
MSTNGPDTRTSGELLVADTVAEWLSDEPDGVSATDRPQTACASCGDPHGYNWLLLTVEWEEHLSEKHGVPQPDEECRVPLCTRCRSWAEMLEIAEMNLGDHGATERERVLDERDRFLDSLRVELITNFEVSASLSVYE